MYFLWSETKSYQITAHFPSICDPFPPDMCLYYVRTTPKQSVVELHWLLLSQKFFVPVQRWTWPSRWCFVSTWDPCLLAVNGAASCFGRSINHPNNSQQGNPCHHRIWTSSARTSALNVFPLSYSGMKKSAHIPRHVHELFYNLMQLPRSSATWGNMWQRRADGH